MQRKLIACVLMILASNAYAGLNGLTFHSRANCGNNESISWDFLKPHTLATISSHTKIDQSQATHVISTGKEHTRRSAAVHWNEGFEGGYVVTGSHYLYYPNSNKLDRWEMSEVTDCGLSDGWWDFDL